MNDYPAIKSFVRRGLMTSGQKKAFDSLWGTFGIEVSLFSQCQQLSQPFEQKILDIGFGYGDSLITQAREHPQQLYIGVEVHRPGIGHCLSAIAEHQLNNLRIVHSDVMLLLPKIEPNTFDRVQCYFPDPWPKRRHHKRRLLNKPFLDACLPALKPGGMLHVATDWQPYAEHILQQLTERPELKNTTKKYTPRPDYRPLTKFEKRGQRLGHDIYDLIFIK